MEAEGVSQLASVRCGPGGVARPGPSHWRVVPIAWDGKRSFGPKALRLAAGDAESAYAAALDAWRRLGFIVTDAEVALRHPARD